jgi:hypothetical protein
MALKFMETKTISSIFSGLSPEKKPPSSTDADADGAPPAHAASGIRGIFSHFAHSGAFPGAPASSGTTLTAAGTKLQEAAVKLQDAAQALRSAASNLGGGAGASAGGSGGDPMSALGAFSIPFYGAGGDIFPGSSGIAGENGPEEISVGASGAHVTPLAARSGGDNHQYFDMRGSIVTEDVVKRAEMAKAISISEQRLMQLAPTMQREINLRSRPSNR